MLGVDSTPFSHETPESACSFFMTSFCRYLSVLTLLLAATGCSVFSGGREFPISEKAKQQLRQEAFLVGPVRHLNSQTDDAITFVVAFDGTLNDRDNVPPGEDKTVVSKLYDYVKAPELGTIAADRTRVVRQYYKGPGCQFGILCWFDAAIGYSSEGTARKAMNALKKFIADRPNGSELNVVAIGFSRGAATARHFLNLVQRESQDGLLSKTQMATHSFAILFDTVATGDAGTLAMALPSNLEFAVHYVALHEARPFFSPVVDDDSFYETVVNAQMNWYLQRVYTMPVPGAHSDLGDSYLKGVGPYVTAHAKSILGNMGLGAPLRADLCPRVSESGEHAVECRTWNEGVHDSRGLFDRLMGVGSPYSCDFQGRFGRKIQAPITHDEATILAQRINHWLSSDSPFISAGSSIRTVGTSNFVFSASLASDVWPLIHPEDDDFAGYNALITYRGDEATLQLTDPYNRGVELNVPKRVLQEISRHDAPVEVELNMTKPNGPWWFVDGCLPEIPD